MLQRTITAFLCATVAMAEWIHISNGIQTYWRARLNSEATWTQWSNPLYHLWAIIENGPFESEAPPDFNTRIQQAYQHYREQRNDVVGGLQEGSQSGNDPGDDEDRAGREDERPGLRGRGEVRLSRTDYTLTCH